MANRGVQWTVEQALARAAGKEGLIHQREALVVLAAEIERLRGLLVERKPYPSGNVASLALDLINRAEVPEVEALVKAARDVCDEDDDADLGGDTLATLRDALKPFEGG